MALFHKIALAATLLALPQVARGQEAPQEASLTEQIARDVAHERMACARDTLPNSPQAETCIGEVEGADQLLNLYDSLRKALDKTMNAGSIIAHLNVLDATNRYVTEKPLPQPTLPGEDVEQALKRKVDYHQQSANADIAKMTAERQCVADKAKMTDTNMTLRAHYETEFARMDKDFPFLTRFPSYSALKTAMFSMLDKYKYQKEVDAISCAVVR